MKDAPILDPDIIEWFRRSLFAAGGVKETPMSERGKQLGDSVDWDKLRNRLNVALSKPSD